MRTVEGRGAVHLLAQEDAGPVADDEPVLHLPPVEGADVFRRLLQHGPQAGFQVRESPVELLPRDFQRGWLRLVELPGIAPQGGVAVLPDVFYNICDGSGNVPFILRTGQDLRKGDLVRV